MEDLSYILNLLAEERVNYFNAVSAPIIQTSNFTFKKVNELARTMRNEFEGLIYTKSRNPTVDILRTKLAALDGAEDCLVVNSGSSAIFLSVFSLVSSGDHIISVRGVYSWAHRMFDHILPRFGVTTSYIDGRELANFEAAILPSTKLIYLESPTSWIFEEQDIAAVAALAKRHNIFTVCDNTYKTPLEQRPVEMGMDLSIQSASKYIGGHSDTIGGVVSGSRELIARIFSNEFLNAGVGIMPFNAWLLLRGLRTLPLRLQRVKETTAVVMEFLKSHAAVEKVIYPASGAFGLFTIVLRGPSLEPVVRFCESLKSIPMAVSWGGHESLVLPRCAGLEDGEFDAANEVHRSVRIYVGLEDAQFIISDFEQALAE